MSLAPTISSSTVGVQLPSFEITKDLASTTRTSRSVVVPVRTSAKAVAPTVNRFGPLYARMFVVALAISNVVLFGLYLFSVNGLEGSAFSLRQQQNELEKQKSAQRQLQVQIAEVTAGVRMRGIAAGAEGFVPVGTPEFIKSAKVETVSMR